MRKTLILLGLLLASLMVVATTFACYTPPECEVDCEPQEIPTPSEEPTPAPHVDSWSQPDPKGPPPDIACAEIEHTPTVNLIERISPTEIKVGWTLTEPVDDYRVFYGLSEDSLIWSVGVENAHEVIIGQLPPNHHIWVSVRGTDGHCLGEASLPKDP